MAKQLTTVKDFDAALLFGRFVPFSGDQPALVVSPDPPPGRPSAAPEVYYLPAFDSEADLRDILPPELYDKVKMITDVAGLLDSMSANPLIRIATNIRRVENGNIRFTQIEIPRSEGTSVH